MFIIYVEFYIVISDLFALCQWQPLATKKYNEKPVFNVFQDIFKNGALFLTLSLSLRLCFIVLIYRKPIFKKKTLILL